MAEVIWDMSQAPYSLDETGDAKVITAAAIAAADTFFNNVANKDTTLVLFYPAGTYHFYGTPTTSEDAAVKILSFFPGGTNDAGKLVFRGAGIDVTKFVVYNNQSHDGTNSTSQYGFLIRNCRRIEVEHFHITVSQQTVSQGTVQSVGAGYVDLLIPSGFATPAELSVDPANAFGKYIRRYSYEHDVNNPRMIQSNNDQIPWTAATDQGSGVWRLTLSPVDIIAAYPIGSVVAIKGKHGKDLFRIVNCFNTSMRHIRLSRKTRAVIINCPDTTVHGIQIARERINGIVACLASPEGGPQFQSTVGGTDTAGWTTGLNIAGCHICGTGDDCIGLFEQSGQVAGNIVRDSFARGIYHFDPAAGCTPAEIESSNTFIRCKLLTEYP